MSLFEDDQYSWRETFFILFDVADRPTAQQLENAIKKLGSSYDVNNLSADEEGRFESLTLRSPDDYAAMDISFASGDEVSEHGAELAADMKAMTLSDEERVQLARLSECNAQFDVYHFEQIILTGDEEEDELFDPGSLLIVLERLAQLCKGIVVDPQSGSLV